MPVVRRWLTVPLLSVLLAASALVALSGQAQAVSDGDVVTPESGGDLYTFSGRMLKDGDYSCTASLITPTVALTALHCVGQVVYQGPAVSYTPASALSVEFGTLNAGQRRGEIYGVTEYRISERLYPLGGIKTDALAFLYLDRPVDPSVARPARLAGADDGVLWRAERRMIALGWGRVSTDGPVSAELRRADVKVLDTTVSFSIYRGMLKTGDIGEGRLQDGDSGGPLLTFDESGPVVVGVLSDSNRTGVSYYMKTGVDPAFD